ncbi:hypothetical protein OHR86_27965 [Streptomyces sp. NBC_00441]|uniref:hypothetical protein n=1 Tax=Streptomyces sp. NBC_00441 TaxID=2975742 RepID=UPI002E2C62DB|nr:hypothetical protein [Streptomyces sp. NBC_00441]
MPHPTTTRPVAVDAPTVVDVPAILMITAALLRNYPTRILTTEHLLLAVMEAAGPTITTAQLRPVWEALPHHPSGDEHGEYAALLVMTARGL